MTSKAHITLNSVLRVMRPLARLLIRQGVSYPSFASALKQVFLEAAQQELADQQMPATDSALSLLSGVHRRDVRNLLRPVETAAADEPAPTSLVAEIVARWMSAPEFSDGQGHARVLPRGAEPGGFDHLVSTVSRDVRARAVLDEMQRLGVVEETPEGIRVLSSSLVPRKDLDKMAELFASNLSDHIAAASLNLQGQANFLEQAVFVDEITEASAAQLQRAAVLAWKQAFKTVMQEAQTRFDEDAAQAAPEDKTHRARFGVYFYSEKDR